MSENIENSDDDLCRTCLKLFLKSKAKSKRLSVTTYNIFHEPDELLEKFLNCTRLFAEIGDGLPEEICADCFEKINDFHEFQKLCKASEKKLCEVKFSKNPPPASRALWQHFNAEDEAPIYDWQIETGENKMEILDISQICKTNVGEQEEEDEKYRAVEGLENPSSKPESPDKKEADDITTDAAKRKQKNSEHNSTDEDNLDLENEDFEESESSADCDSDAESSEEDEAKSRASRKRKHKENSSNSEDLESECESDAKDKTNKATDGPKKKKRIKNRNPIPIQFYNCDVCPRRFVIEHKLVAHKRIHEGLVPYPCTYPECHRGFKHRHSLEVHLRQHTGSNVRFKCQEPDCGKSYVHKLSLRWHMRKFHNQGPQVKKHCCETCGKCYGTAVALGEHIYTHGDKSDYPFACSYENCGQRFIKKEKLNIHLMRHAGIKKHVCPHCGMRKTTREELTIHVNYHTHEKTYSCELCARVFTNPGNLKNHIRVVHKGIKNFVCRFCGQKFSTSESCKYHENIHTGEKPFECSNCGQRFAQPGSLRSHKKRCVTHQEDQQTLEIEKNQPVQDSSSIMQSCQETIVVTPLQDIT